MSYIDYVHARQILDSRGNPTLEVEVGTGDGSLAVRPFLQERPRVSTKPLSFAMAETPGWARA